MIVICSSLFSDSVIYIISELLNDHYITAIIAMSDVMCPHGDSRIFEIMTPPLFKHKTIFLLVRGESLERQQIYTSVHSLCIQVHLFPVNLFYGKKAVILYIKVCYNKLAINYVILFPTLLP